MKQFVTPHNGTFKVQTQKINQKSKTIPDEALTIREIFQKFANGAPLEGKEEVYFEDQIFRDPSKMDLADVEAWKDSLEEEAREAEEKLDKEVEKRKRKKQQQERKKMEQQLLQQQQQQQQQQQKPEEKNTI